MTNREDAVNTITTRTLIETAMHSINEAGAGQPDPITLDAPPSDRPGHGGPVEWHPLVALAAAGHIVQHWTAGHRYRGPFEIESGRHVGHAATLTSPATGTQPALRMEGGGFPDQGDIWVRELCGHTGCTANAPAGPGSRCHDHLGDPAPDGQSATHWAQLAAAAWRRQHPTAGEEARLLDNDRRALITGATRAGLTKMELHRATGIARTTIDRIIDPPAPVDFDDDNAPA